jgi:hypothetical protein
MPKVPLETVSTMAGFADWVAAILARWTVKGQVENPWFRGAGNSEHSLVPGIYRTLKGREPDADDELRTEFSRKGLPLVSGRPPENDWEWYFLMQHFRAPTRLLDWTDAALVALYFALSSWKPSESAEKSPKPAVWALNPFKMNGRFKKVEGPFNVDDDEAECYLPPAYSRRRLPKYPIAIDPALISQRMLVQHSHFTVHGSDPRGIDEMKQLKLKDGLVKVVIDLDKDDLEYFQQHLAVLGITETSVFPDLEGLGRELRLDYRLDESRPAAS